MTKRPDQIKLSLGAAADSRRRALIDLAVAIQVTGRNGDVIHRTQEQINVATT